METKTKKKAVFAACASMSIAMISLVTTAVLAYIIADYHGRQGLPISTVLLIMTATPLVGLFVSFSIGPIALWVPKKILLVIPPVITICLGIVFVNFGGIVPYWVLILCGAFNGFVNGILGPIPNSVVADYADSREEAAKYQGWCNATMQGGAMVMSLIGGALGVTRWQNAYLLYFLAVPVLLIVIFMLPMDHPVKPEKKAESSGNALTQIPGIVYIRCIQYMLIFVVVYTFSVNISSYIITTHKLGTSFHTGISTALMTLFSVIAGVTYGKYARKLKNWVAPFMVLLVVLGFAATSFITSSLSGAFTCAVLIGFAKVGIVPFCIGKVVGPSPKRLAPVCIALLMGSMQLGMFISTNLVEVLCRVFFADGVTVDNKFLMSLYIAIAALVFAIVIYIPKFKVDEQAQAPAH
jgi:MFS family permease